MRFAELEKEIYEIACDIAREITVKLLEGLDEKIMSDRDKKKFRLKQSIKNTIKTIYGDVEYPRRYYKNLENGEYVYLLDEELGIGKYDGLFSSNMMELIAEACMDMSYGKAAEHISEATNQYVSKTACWNVVQELGKKINDSEKKLIRDNSEVNTDGKETNVLFEETDGVWLRTQKKDKKKGKALETKIVTIYEGRKKENPEELVGKIIVGGETKSNKLKKKTEAVINSVYNIDEIKLRVISGDGANWINEMSDGEVVHQLDRFHVLQYINRYIKNKEHRKKVKELLAEKKIDEMLEHIETIYNSVASDGDKETEGLEKLLSYLKNNKDYILRYNERPDVTVPEPEEGIIYKNMGVQENQNCTLITMRMKHRRMRWSEAGANNLIELICLRENKKMEQLFDITDFDIPIKNGDIKKAFSCADIPKKVGKDKYFEQYKVLMPILSSNNSPLVEVLRNISN